jgi:hypothetical protein
VQGVRSRALSCKNFFSNFNTKVRNFLTYSIKESYAVHNLTVFEPKTRRKQSDFFFSGSVVVAVLSSLKALSLNNEWYVLPERCPLAKSRGEEMNLSSLINRSSSIWTVPATNIVLSAFSRYKQVTSLIN